MTDPSRSAARFSQLLAALSRRTATPLEARDGLLILIDAGETIQLVVEQSGAGETVDLVARLMAIPQEDPGGALALRLLRFNADRAALDGAVIAVDGPRRQFVLIQECPLGDDAEALADRVEALMALAAIVRSDAAGDRSFGAGTAALLLRAHRGAR